MLHYAFDLHQLIAHYLNFQSEITNSQLFRRNVTEKWRTVAEKISVKWAEDYPSHEEISNAKILGKTIKQ